MRFLDFLIEQNSSSWEEDFKPVEIGDDFSSQLKSMEHKRDMWNAKYKRLRSNVFSQAERLKNDDGSKGKWVASTDSVRYDRKFIVIANHMYTRTPRLEEALARHNKLETRCRQAEKTYEKFSKVCRQLEKDRLQQQQDQLKSTTHQVNVDVSKIPLKVGYILNGPGRFENPYHKGGEHQYAGHPAHFEFTRSTLPTFQHISAQLKRNNLPPLTFMYAGTHARMKGAPLNFVIYGVDGKFCWRRYDAGGGSGVESFFAHEERMKNLYVSGDDVAKQDKAWREAFPEYFK